MKSLYLSFCVISEVICVVLMTSPGYESEVGIAVLMVATSFMTALLIEVLEGMENTSRAEHRRGVGRWVKRGWH